jgi:hypothetical protein
VQEYREEFFWLYCQLLDRFPALSIIYEGVLIDGCALDDLALEEIDMQNKQERSRHDEQEDDGMYTVEIERLKKILPYRFVPSPEILIRVSKLVVSLPEPQRTMGLKAIVEHITNSMSLHYLDLMATFKEKAEQEGIDQEEQEGTFEDIFEEGFQMMMELSSEVTIQSLRDFEMLCSALISAYVQRYEVSASDAQSALYSLPNRCYRPLQRKNLLQAE